MTFSSQKGQSIVKSAVKYKAPPHRSNFQAKQLSVNLQLTWTSGKICVGKVFAPMWNSQSCISPAKIDKHTCKLKHTSFNMIRCIRGFSYITRRWALKRSIITGPSDYRCVHAEGLFIGSFQSDMSVKLLHWTHILLERMPTQCTARGQLVLTGEECHISCKCLKCYFA